MTNNKNSQTPPYAKIRVSKRAHYDRAAVFDVLDTGLVAHVSFILDDRPMIIPMIYARRDERLYLHGAKAARIIKLNDGALASLCVTHIDGLVVAKSAFHHSVNYRSVVVHGRLKPVEDAVEKEAALALLTNHLLPERWDEVRPMTKKEANATGVLSLDIEAASAKIRSGPPVEDDTDLDLPIWAGELPVSLGFAAPIASQVSGPGSTGEIPASLKAAKEKFKY